MNSTRTFITGILAVILVAVVLDTAGAEKKGTTIRGYVLDSACAFMKNLKKPVSRDCAIACAKAGSPLVILGDDRIIYWPISSEMPATGQNQRLMQFAGQRVIASGKVLARGGSHALVIGKIEAAVVGK